MPEPIGWLPGGPCEPMPVGTGAAACGRAAAAWAKSASAIALKAVGSPICQPMRLATCPDSKGGPNLLVSRECWGQGRPSSLGLEGLQGRIGFGKDCDSTCQAGCGSIDLFHQPSMIGVGTGVLLERLGLASHRSLETVRVGAPRLDRMLGTAEGLGGVGQAVCCRGQVWVVPGHAFPGNDQSFGSFQCRFGF